MRAVLSHIRLFALVLLMMAPWDTMPAQADIRDLIPFGRTHRIANLLPAVVSISMIKLLPDEAAQTRRVEMFGSGFIVDPTGVIITNRHVISDVVEISVTLQGGRTVPARIIGVSNSIDIALLKIDVEKPLPAVKWGDSDRLHVGDQVLAVGNPLGVGELVSAGIISGLNRNIRISPFDDFIQTDAAINHGNSGGPLVDMRGEVIGMNTAIFSPGENTGSIGIGFAIPASDVQFVVDQLRRSGRVRLGSVGLGTQDMTADIAEAVGLAQPRGVIVASVDASGPAAKAGIEEGDVILSAAGQVPKDVRAFARQTARGRIGSAMPLGIWRNGREMSVPVTVAEWPGEAQAAAQKPAAVPRLASTNPTELGFQLAELTSERRAQFKLPAGTEGVLVTEVAPNSTAADRAFAPGDVILRVQGDAVTTPDEVQQRLADARALKRRNALLLIRHADRQQFVSLPIAATP